MGTAYQIHDQDATYFMTFQVVGWADVFSRQVYRDIIIDSFKFCRQHKHMGLHAYVIMTNHMHVIMSSNNGELSGLVRDFKKFTSKRILSLISKNPRESRQDWMELIFKYHAKYNKRCENKQFWTHHNHAVELSSNRMFDRILNYIHNNPVKAGWVNEPEDYIYSSASNYAAMDSVLEIDMI